MAVAKLSAVADLEYATCTRTTMIPMIQYFQIVVTFFILSVEKCGKQPYELVAWQAPTQMYSTSFIR